ncbi:MAG TPA: hypothetical protein VMR17_07115, partial [Xanthobacteraceae bacterium]|nr:hypothetical protein [Xanthobacteraceae bacterium]
MATAIFIASCIPAQAQLSISTQACTAALAYLKQAQIQPLDRSIFFSGALDSSRTWTQSISLPIFSGDVTVPLTDDQVFLAYFLVRSVPDGGAVSAKISITAGPNDKPTNYVNLHRQAIKHADNRCLSRDLPRMDRVVRVNEYIDYHDPSKGGLSSDLEDFHFRYPVGSTSCAATNAPDVLSTFRFDNVSPTVGDSFLSRHFSLTTPAYAAGSNFS